MSRLLAAGLILGSMFAASAGTPAAPGPASPSSAVAPAPTTDEILARYVKAIGGHDKLKSVRSMRMHGTMTAAGGFSATYLVELKRPSSIRTEFEFSNKTTAVQVSDGKQGWILVPKPGQPIATSVPMTEQQMQDLQQTADIDGPLVDSKSKGYTVELVGKEPVGNTQAWNLKLTDKSGVVRNFFLDPQTYFPIKQVIHKTVDGKEVESEMRLSDYREVSGLRYPYLLESAGKAGQGGQRLALDKIEVNPTIEASRFAMPAVTSKPPAKAGPAKPSSPTP